MQARDPAILRLVTKIIRSMQPANQDRSLLCFGPTLSDGWDFRENGEQWVFEGVGSK